MADITRECAEQLIDVASAIGVMQGLASAGFVDQNMIDEAIEAIEQIPAGACLVSEGAKDSLKELAERAKALAGDQSMDASVNLQEALNSALKSILA